MYARVDTFCRVVAVDANPSYTVRDDDDDDPVLLLHPGGEVVDTWRENYPYDDRMTPPSTRNRSACCRSNCLSCRSGARSTGIGRCWCSRAATPPARAAPSNGSWNTSTRAAPA